VQADEVVGNSALSTDEADGHPSQSGEERASTERVQALEAQLALPLAERDQLPLLGSQRRQLESQLPASGGATSRCLQ
jgi:hypothetical protein